MARFTLKNNSKTDCKQIFSVTSLVYLFIVGLIICTVQSPYTLPQLRSKDIPSSQFSGERAYSCIKWLSEEIGNRALGSKANLVAIKQFVEKLENLRNIAHPNLSIEIELQTASGSYLMSGRNFTYHYQNLTNVLMRYSKRGSSSTTALLISAHIDSVFSGPGASDNGMGACTMLEIANNLVVSEPTYNDIIFNFNNGEEMGLLGAHAFISKHRWSSHVKSFINLDNMGNMGNEVLFNACYESDWMIDLYSKVAPYPSGNVMSKDVFETNIVPSDTDFHVYKDFAQVPGIDFAFGRNSYFYHTNRDMSSEINPRSVQHVGSNVLAITNASANYELLSKIEKSSKSKDTIIFYDILGVFLISLPFQYQRIMNWILIGFIFIISLFKISKSIYRKRNIKFINLLLLFIIRTICVIIGLFLTAIFSIGFPGFILGNIMKFLGLQMIWFSSSSMILPLSLFGFPSLLGIMIAQMIYHKSSMVFLRWLARRDIPLSGQSNTQIIQRVIVRDTNYIILFMWSILMILATNAKIGSSYMTSWWCFGILLSILIQSDWYIKFIIATVIPLLVTSQFLWILLLVELPTLGRTRLPPSNYLSTDVVAGTIVGLFMFFCTTTMLPWLHKSSTHWGKTIKWLSIATITILAISSLNFPYSYQTPKKLLVHHNLNYDVPGGKTSIQVTSYDSYPVGKALRKAFEWAEWSCTETTCIWYPDMIDQTGWKQLGTPSLTLKESKYIDAIDSRKLTIGVHHPNATISRVRFWTPDLLWWSLEGDMIPQRDPMNSTNYFYWIRHVSSDDSDWEFSIEFQGRSKLDFVLTVGYWDVSLSPPIQRIEHDIPDWMIIDGWDSFHYITQNKTYTF